MTALTNLQLADWADASYFHANLRFSASLRKSSASLFGESSFNIYTHVNEQGKRERDSVCTGEKKIKRKKVRERESERVVREEERASE